ncbi:MAG: hypothetical protein RJA36_282 [Pseudomonadota bacterium]
MQLLQEDRVDEVNVDWLLDGWVVYGSVQGSQRWPYEVSIDLELDAQGKVLDWIPDCTCPVGFECKHAVALLLKAASLSSHRTSEAPRALSPAEQARASQAATAARRLKAEQQAEAELQRWLQALRPEPPRASPSGVTRPEYLFYLLSLQPAGDLGWKLQLDVKSIFRKVNGDWSKPRPLGSYFNVTQPQYQGQLQPADHEVIQLLPAMRLERDRYQFGMISCVEPRGSLGVVLLQRAASTGRLYSQSPSGELLGCMQWGEPLALAWEWREMSVDGFDEPVWSLSPRLPSDTARLCAGQPMFYLDSVQGRCGLVECGSMTQAQALQLLRAPRLPAPLLRKHQLALLEHLPRGIALPPVLPDLRVLQGLVPGWHLHLSPVSAHLQAVCGLLQAVLRFDYGGHRGFWSTPATTVLLSDAQGSMVLHRDLASEQEASSCLQRFGLLEGPDGLFGLPGDRPQALWLDWAEQDFKPLRVAGFVVELSEELQGWIRHADGLSVEWSHEGESETGSPWFDLSLGLEIEGRRHNVLPLLPELLARLVDAPLDGQTGQPRLPEHVYLPDPGGAGFVRLPTEAIRPWLSVLLELVDERGADLSGAQLRLSRLEAMRALALLGKGVVWEGMQQLRTLVDSLGGQELLPAVAVPAGLQAELRPYQQHGLDWLQFLGAHGLAGILADDMGLGKTLQTLAHVQLEKEAGRLTTPALVIAPVSLLGNWQREATRFCPGLRTLVMHGGGRHEAAAAMADHDLVIAPYSLLQRDRERWLSLTWHLVVLDEAQNIKNASTQAAQVVFDLKARQRLCLSGTPMENHLGELWSLFHFLMPGFLGSREGFRRRFRMPIERQGDVRRQAELRARLTPFMLRRTKALVAHELPPKVETLMRVELSGKQADLYETVRLGMEKAVREALSSRGLAKSQITILDALLKLRQVCCDPRLLKLDAAAKVKGSAKLEQLMELLTEMLAEGRRVLLFSQFTSMLTLIEAELRQRGLIWTKLTGQSRNRDAIIEQFTSGQVPLFLISLKSGGVGLNLPQADTVIHYDPWWNPAVENQATDRAHRIGQTQSVWVVKLVAQGTIEERILEMQERKAALAQSMYQGSAARQQPMFSEDDLNELLKPLA